MEAPEGGVDGESLKRLAILTSGRQDWGILRSTALRLQARPGFDLTVLAGGMHLHPSFGMTIDGVRADGFMDPCLLDWMGPGEVPSAAVQSARALEQVFQALEQTRPEGVLLVGDRFETLAAGLAAVLARVPIIHLHGGEESEGALDNSFRHALSKLAHLHLVSNSAYRDRLMKMGESEKSIHVVGAPGLDNLHRADLLSRAEMEALLGGQLASPLVMVTYHPATLGQDTLAEAQAIVGVMSRVHATYVVSMPNSDPGAQAIRSVFESACAGRPNCFLVAGLGERRYWSLLRFADAILGNSSSGLIEAPAAMLPAVNVGDRQRGRIRCANVLDVPRPTIESIELSLRRALDPRFRADLQAQASPFGNGHSAAQIEEILAGWTPPNPPIKLGVAQ